MVVAQNFEGASDGSDPTEAAASFDVAPASGEPAHRQAPSSQPSLWAVNAFSATLGLSAVALLVWGPLYHAAPIHPSIPQPVMFVILTVMWAAAAWAPVSLHYRGNTYLFVLEEVPMLLGLVFLSPTLLVLCGVCAEAFVRAGPRRQPAVKLLFNVSSGALSIALAAVVYRELLNSSSPMSVRGWIAAAAALCTSMAVTTLTVRVVMRMNGQTTERRTGVQFTTEAMLMAANMCLSFVVLDLAWFSLWATVPLVLVAGLIIGAYRGYARLTLRFASLQRLYDFSRALGTARLEAPSMSVDVLRQVCTVMRARRAELVLTEPRAWRAASRLTSGISGFEPISLDELVHRRHGDQHGNRCGSTTAWDMNGIVWGRPDLGCVPPRGRCSGDERRDGHRCHCRLRSRRRSWTASTTTICGFSETLVKHASASLERVLRLVEELRFEVDSKSYQATHDALTGLPNRVLFQARAAGALSESEGLAVVLLDIDRFKDVNDTLGHGDRRSPPCMRVSERLVRSVSGRFTVARLGGDEFALVIGDISVSEQAVAIVKDLHRELARPIRMDGLNLAVTASAGIALSPEHGDDVALLLQRADIAMYLQRIATARSSSTRWTRTRACGGGS